jgi:hypothetical protein
MSYPSEYPQPLVRVTNVQCPVVSGYTTYRLRREDPLFVSGDVGVYEDAAHAQVTLHNVGTTSVGVQLKMADTTSPPGTDSTGAPSGTRDSIGSAITLVPGGSKTLNVTPYEEYLEVWGTSGTGSIRMQISSRVRWQEMAFDKSDTLQFKTLWNMVPVPSAPSI